MRRVQEQIDKFLDAVDKGSTVFVHPKTLEKLRKYPQLSYFEFETSEFIEEGTLCAINMSEYASNFSI